MSEKFREETAEAKVLLRKTVAAKRAGLGEFERAEKSHSTCKAFVDDFPTKSGDKIAAYWPIGDEIDCKPLIENLRMAGIAIALPTIVGANLPLVMREFEGADSLISARFGTSEPTQDAKIVVPDVIILPLLAFDKTGARLGYGGGFYDRTIAAMEEKPVLVGMAFDIQQEDFVPTSSHDISLDMIVTESGLYRFN